MDAFDDLVMEVKLLKNVIAELEAENKHLQRMKPTWLKLSEREHLKVRANRKRRLNT